MVSRGRGNEAPCLSRWLQDPAYVRTGGYIFPVREDIEGHEDVWTSSPLPSSSSAFFLSIIYSFGINGPLLFFLSYLNIIYLFQYTGYLLVSRPVIIPILDFIRTDALPLHLLSNL